MSKQNFLELLLFNKTFKMKIKCILLVLFALAITCNAEAQKNNKKLVITGTVMDGLSQPVANAIVMIDGKNTNSVTDANGKYKVKVSQKASKIGILTFTAGLMEQSIDGRSEVNFQFSKSGANTQVDQAASPGEESVNTGYVHVKEKDVLTNISRVDGTGKNYNKYKDIYDMIQRTSAGVRVNGDNIVIQDSKDLFGSVSALLIVDGIPTQTIANIPPSSVESIEILKGTAAAIYGSRGYGGAVVIKTKKAIE
jgi:TonB-dependent SusC/RagA subfamily outer membrane receptor